MKRRSVAAFATMLSVVCLAACGTQSSTQTSATTVSEANTEAVESETETETEGGDSSDLSTIISEAVERNASRTGIQDAWTGPTSGPAAVADKTIVCINADSANAVEAMWGEAVQTACERIGWNCTVLDGKGTVQGQTSAINQAVAMGADGIVTSADAEALQAVIVEAENAGVPTVGIHATNTIGPDESLHLTYNIASDATQIGYALADYAIAESKGEGRVIILYDAQYAIARQKMEAMKERIESVESMELLDVVNTPLGEVSTNMPQLASSWISQYGTEKPIYVLSIADLYYDYVTPTLRTGGIDPASVILVGSDGTTAAYSRIRSGDYQAVTVPEPGTMFGFMAVDALNRYFAGEEQYIFSPDVYLVTAENVDSEGGEEDMFIPSNNFADEYAKIWGVN